MRFLILLLLCNIFLYMPAKAASDDIWTLERCVQYALSHNISIQQNVLNARLAALTLKQSQLSQLPNANAGPAYGRSYGRSVDPTTNQYVIGSYDFLSLSGNADVLLFGWFQRRNTIRQNDLSHKAALADLDQLKDDVSLNVATGYLRALLAKEQITVNEKQVSLSQQQLDQTQRFADAGRVPELNVAQLTSQVATDSSNLITAIADYTASILDLKALLNLDFEVPFEIQAPAVDVPAQNAVMGQSPEAIYNVAERNFGSIKSSEFKLAAAEKQLKAAKGALYPTLGFSTQLGSNFATTFKDYGTPNITGQVPNGTFVDISGTRYPVYQPTYVLPVTGTTPLNTQLNNNFRHTYTLSLSIPLFNAWQAQAAVHRSRINVESQELNKTQAQLNLKQNVYKAYNDARNSLQKYYAAQRAADAAGRAFEFAQRRYDIGMTNTVEYLVIQNNQYKADASLSSAKYDLIFRLKVIDYYLGNPLKL
jgi:outer membrane protein